MAINIVQSLRKFVYSCQKTPIAWLQLKYQRTQTISGIIGIICITSILFLQVGLRNSFLEGVLQIPFNLNADILLVNSVSSSILQPVSFSSRHLYQSLADEHVAAVMPFYITGTKWKDAQHRLHRIRVNIIGIPTNNLALNLKGVAEHLNQIQPNESALFDRISRHEFKPIIEEFIARNHAIVEIQTASAKEFERLNVTGLFELGVNNAYDATFIVNETTFIKLFARDKDKIDVGLIQLKSGHNSPEIIRQVVENLKNNLPQNIHVFSKSDLIKNERIFHESNSPIGFVFTFMMMVTILISIFILYQILYVKIANNLGNYATLKAIGFSHISLVMIVIQESLILGVAGYIPGVIVSSLAFAYLADATKLLIQMEPLTAAMIFGLICLICLLSAVISLIKLQEADPIEIFS
jgi:putative ABC transport system permease protein